MAKSRGRKFAEITSPTSGVFDLTSVPTITNAKLQNSAMTLAGSSVSLGGTGVANTDALSEGSSNLYFTNARVQSFLGGGTLAGNIVVPDNRSIYVGSSSDFRIVHNTTNTQLINATGALQITSNGGFDVTGAATFSSTITATGNITGTLATAAQTNITSVGTLSALAVNSGTTNTVATFTSSDAGAGINLTDNSGTSTLQTNGVNLRIGVDEAGAVSSSAIQFRVDGSTKATLDSSGNLQVGTAQTFPAFNNVVGAEVGGFGMLSASRDGAESIQLNRKTSDGTIALFKKDGSDVGHIGTTGGKLYIGTTDGSDAFLRFESNEISPSAHNGSFRDAVISLGKTSSRFNNLYLSGTLNGITTTRSVSGTRWGVLPEVASNGVMEIGRYLDFHATSGDTSDYGARFDYDGSKMILTSPLDVTGTLNVAGQVASTTVDTGTLYVGNNNTEFSENNLYAKSGGHFYIDHNTVGQDFIFRVSNSSSRDMYGPRFFASGAVSVGPDNSTTSAHQMKINSTTMGLRIKSGSGGYSSLTWSGDGENTIGSITTTTNQIYFGSQNSGGTGSNGELLVEPRSGSNKRVLTLKSTGNIHGPINGGPLSFAGLGCFNIMDMEREWLDLISANSGSEVTSHTSTSNVQGPSMSHPGSSSYGYSKIKYADHPTGGAGVVLESTAGSSSTWNGGWNSSTFTVDRHKPYLYTCYVRRTSSAAAGTFYFGLYNAYPQGTSTTVDTNPYMVVTSSSNLVQHVWHLVYCMLYPREYNGTGVNAQNPGDLRGLWRIDNMDRRAGQTGWRHYQDSQQMRSYLYYAGDSATSLQWARPGVWVMDGNQPTFGDLINAHGISELNEDT